MDLNEYFPGAGFRSRHLPQIQIIDSGKRSAHNGMHDSGLLYAFASRYAGAIVDTLAEALYLVAPT